MPETSISWRSLIAVAHDVQPFGIVDDLLGDQQLAVDQAAELAEDLLHLGAQLGRMHQEDAHLLVVAEGGAAVDQRVVGALRQALRLRRHIGLVEVPQEHGGERDDVADARAVIVPGRARGLVGLVEIGDVELVHQPHDGRRIARDVAALAAGLVVPEIGGRDLLVPAVERVRHDRLVLLVDAVDEDLAVLLELPHGVADVFVAVLLGQHGALVDALLDPVGGRRASAGVRFERPPFVAEAADRRLPVLPFSDCRSIRSCPPSVGRCAGPTSSSSSSCSSSHSSYSSRFSSMTSETTSKRFSSTVSSWSSTPVASQIV